MGISDQAIGFTHEDQYCAARELFATAGYSEEGIHKYLGGRPATPIAAEIPPLVLPAVGGTDLEILMRLFLLGLPADIGSVRKIFQPMSLEDWCEAGITKVSGEEVVPQLKIVPYQQFLMASDLPTSLAKNSDKNNDYVMGIAGSSLTIAQSTIRRQVGSTLDLGTGCGIQAFLASAHSDHVCAVDQNPRAVYLTRFNAALNGVNNIECFEGDLFTPVQGKKFDLIVSNPPFVISPEFRAQYRDGGMEGDQFCQRIIAEAPEYLADNGFCQIICNWAQKKDEEWQDRLSTWFAGNGCFVWAMRGKTMSLDEYTRTWNQSGREESFGKTYREWMAYFEREQIESIGAGVITMRRSPDGQSGFRAEEAPPLNGPIGDDLQEGFRLCDFLQSVPEDRQLLDQKMRVAPHVKLTQEFKPSDQGWQTTQLRVVRTKGFGYSTDVDSETANIMHMSNGARTLGDVIQETARQRKVSAESLASSTLPRLRNLIARAFMVPAGDVGNQED